jgi:hypothetical protein
MEQVHDFWPDRHSRYFAVQKDLVCVDVLRKNYIRARHILKTGCIQEVHVRSEETYQEAFERWLQRGAQEALEHFATVCGYCRKTDVWGDACPVYLRTVYLRGQIAHQ